MGRSLEGNGVRPLTGWQLGLTLEERPPDSLADRELKEEEEAVEHQQTGHSTKGQTEPEKRARKGHDAH